MVGRRRETIIKKEEAEEYPCKGSHFVFNSIPSFGCIKGRSGKKINYPARVMVSWLHSESHPSSSITFKAQPLVAIPANFSLVFDAASDTLCTCLYHFQANFSRSLNTFHADLEGVCGQLSACHARLQRQAL